MKRILAAILLALLLGPTSAAAQTPPAGQSAQPPRPGAPAPARTGECALLPGGKAPVAHIADLTTPLSPHSLDLVYFGKRLGELTPADFERIAELSKRCPPGDGMLADDKLQKLQAVVREAQKARNTSVSWAKQRMAEMAALPAGRERLTRLNQLWTELETHEGAMTREDVDGFAAWIAREQQALYDATSQPRPRPPASAPPGPPAEAHGAAPPAQARSGRGRPRTQGGEEE